MHQLKKGYHKDQLWVDYFFKFMLTVYLTSPDDISIFSTAYDTNLSTEQIIKDLKEYLRVSIQLENNIQL